MDEDFVFEDLIRNGVIGYRRTADLRIDKFRPVQEFETPEQRQQRVLAHKHRIRSELANIR